MCKVIKFFPFPLFYSAATPMPLERRLSTQSSFPARLRWQQNACPSPRAFSFQSWRPCVFRGQYQRWCFHSPISMAAAQKTGVLFLLDVKSARCRSSSGTCRQIQMYLAESTIYCAPAFPPAKVSLENHCPIFSQKPYVGDDGRRWPRAAPDRDGQEPACWVISVFPLTIPGGGRFQ